MRYEWFRCFPTNYLDGVRGMGDELAMGYTRLFMEMYAIGGPVKLDVQRLKFLLEKRPQDVKRIVGQLVEMGKLRIDEDGFIHNGRTEEELARKRGWERNEGANSASSPQSSPQSSDAQQASQSPGHNRKKRSKNHARTGDHAGASRTARPEAEAEGNKAQPTAESFITNALPIEVSSLRPATNGMAEGSALAGERSLEGRSPPEPSGKVEEAVPPFTDYADPLAGAPQPSGKIEPSPALLRSKLVTKATGLMAVLQPMPKEDDDDAGT